MISEQYMNARQIKGTKQKSIFTKLEGFSRARKPLVTFLTFNFMH